MRFASYLILILFEASIISCSGTSPEKKKLSDAETDSTNELIDPDSGSIYKNRNPRYDMLDGRPIVGEDSTLFDLNISLEREDTIHTFDSVFIFLDNKLYLKASYLNADKEHQHWLVCKNGDHTAGAILKVGKRKYSAQLKLSKDSIHNGIQLDYFKPKNYDEWLELVSFPRAEKKFIEVNFNIDSLFRSEKEKLRKISIDSAHSFPRGNVFQFYAENLFYL